MSEDIKSAEVKNQKKNRDLTVRTNPDTSPASFHDHIDMGVNSPPVAGQEKELPYKQNNRKPQVATGNNTAGNASLSEGKNQDIKLTVNKIVDPIASLSKQAENAGSDLNVVQLEKGNQQEPFKSDITKNPAIAEVRTEDTSVTMHKNVDSNVSQYKHDNVGRFNDEKASGEAVGQLEEKVHNDAFKSHTEKLLVDKKLDKQPITVVHKEDLEDTQTVFNLLWFMGHIGSAVLTLGYFGFGWNSYYFVLSLNCISYGVTMFWTSFQSSNMDYLILCIACLGCDPFWPLLISLAAYSFSYLCKFIKIAIVDEYCSHWTRTKMTLAYFAADKAFLRYITYIIY